MMIDKNTGKEIRKILFGDKKDPDYKLDELGRLVYYKSNGNEIQGFLGLMDKINGEIS